MSLNYCAIALEAFKNVMKIKNAITGHPVWALASLFYSYLLKEEIWPSIPKWAAETDQLENDAKNFWGSNDWITLLADRRYGKYNFRMRYNAELKALDQLQQALDDHVAKYGKNDDGNLDIDGMELSITERRKQLRAELDFFYIFHDALHRNQESPAEDEIRRRWGALQTTGCSCGPECMCPLPKAPEPDEEGRVTGTVTPYLNPKESPIVLDLDGDGIETSGVNDSRAMFDFDGDGIKNRTGWLNSDDGFLVLDRNQDGLINNGLELFGDNTQRYDGSGKCVDGFEALAQEDTNGDGVVNNLDANWSRIKVWRDLNMNGQSDAGEL